MTHRLQDLIKSSLHRHKLDAHYTANTILTTCKELIAENAPQKVAEAVQPAAYQHGVLFLTVSKNAAAQEFHFYSEEILKKLKEKYPNEDIRRFVFRLRPSDSNIQEV